MRVQRSSIAAAAAAAILAAGPGEAGDSGNLQVDVVRGGAVSRVVVDGDGAISEVTMREAPRASAPPQPSTAPERRAEPSAQTTIYLIVNRSDDRSWRHRELLALHPALLPRLRHPARPVRYRYRLGEPQRGGSASARGGQLRF